MPKNRKSYDDKISTTCGLDMKADLLTISYQTGNGEQYGSALRMMLKDAITRYKEELPDRKRKDFDEIRRNVLLILFKKSPEQAKELYKSTQAVEREPEPKPVQEE